MKNLIIGSTALLVLLLFIGGIFYPNTLEMRLADTSIFFSVVRAVIIVLLVTLLVTNPPRSKTLRSIIGAWAVVLMVMSSSVVFSYSIELLDALVFMQVAIILGIEAMEITPSRLSQTRRIPVRHAPPAPRKINVTTA